MYGAAISTWSYAIGSTGIAPSNTLQVRSPHLAACRRRVERRDDLPNERRHCDGQAGQH